MAAFPLRLVYMKAEADGSCPAVRVLFSVPKRCFKRAVKRNRVKRQLREAYRLNKGILHERLGKHDGMGVALAFIWLDDKLWPTPEVEKRLVNLMQRLAERIGRI